MKALILSGGSVRGAFQAGATAEVLQTFSPDFIYGVSVGALNGAFLTDRAARPEFRDGDTILWSAIGTALKGFWTNNIREPQDLVVERSWLSVGLSELLYKNFNGLTNTKPLIELLKRTLTIENLRASPVKLKVGYTDIGAGTYHDGEPSDPNFIGYMLASAHMPIIMPLVKVGEQLLTDGGVLNVSPVESALRDRTSRNITEIVCVTCQAETLRTEVFHEGSLLAMVERTIDAMNREVVNNDLRLLGEVNTQIADGTRTSSVGKQERIITATSIRPAQDPTVDIRSFTSADIQTMIAEGRVEAQKVMPQHGQLMNNNLVA